jgi:hypothetical protein
VHVRDPAVVVGEQRLPAEHRVGTDAVELVGLQMPWFQRAVGGAVGRLRRVERLGVDDRGRGVPVVEQRRVGREALLPHQLLGIQSTFRGAELRVTLAGHTAQTAKIWHDALPVPAWTCSVLLPSKAIVHFAD